MQCVPEHIVERTWDRIADMGLRETRALMKTSGPFQEELVGFALAFTHELGPDVGGVTMYITVVVFEMFRELGEKHIRRVDDDAVMQHLERNEALLRDGTGEIDELAAMVAALGPMQERFVMRYVTDTLAQATDDDSGFDLTMDDVCHMFLVLKTIVDCLHDSCDWSRIQETVSA